MNDSINNMIESLKKTGGDEIKYTFEVEKDEKEYIFTMILKEKEDNDET